MDLNASEFKLHKECRKMLMRPVWPQINTTHGDPIGNFDKLVSHINSHVIDLNHPLEMKTAMKLYLGSDTDKASGETLKKSEQRLKKKLLDYYTEKILVLQTYWYSWCNNKCITFVRSI